MTGIMTSKRIKSGFRPRERLANIVVVVHDQHSGSHAQPLDARARVQLMVFARRGVGTPT